jgi:hypothetical protein
LQREPQNTASHKALSRQARRAAARRKPSARTQGTRRAAAAQRKAA